MGNLKVIEQTYAKQSQNNEKYIFEQKERGLA